jgi:hypothetical protein
MTFNRMAFNRMTFSRLTFSRMTFSRMAFNRMTKNWEFHQTNNKNESGTAGLALSPTTKGAN